MFARWFFTECFVHLHSRHVSGESNKLEWMMKKVCHDEHQKCTDLSTSFEENIPGDSFWTFWALNRKSTISLTLCLNIINLHFIFCQCQSQKDMLIPSQSHYIFLQILLKWFDGLLNGCLTILHRKLMSFCTTDVASVFKRQGFWCRVLDDMEKSVLECIGRKLVRVLLAIKIWSGKAIIQLIFARVTPILHAM